MPNAGEEELSAMAIALVGMNNSISSCKTAYLKINSRKKLGQKDIERFAKIIERALDKLFAQ